MDHFWGRFLTSSTALLLPIISLLTIGCGNAFEGQRSLSSSEGSNQISDNLAINGQALYTDAQLQLKNIQTITFTKDVDKKYKAWSDQFLEKEIVLSALIHGNCSEMTNDNLAQRIVAGRINSESLSQDIFAVSVKLAERTSIGAIATAVDRSPCVLKMENEILADLNIPGPDPQINKQTFLSEIKWEKASQLIDHQPGDKHVVVAVIDSGIDYLHEDLQSVMWQNAQGQFGYDFYNDDTDPKDEHFHGTYVSGILAAHTQNSLGVAGVAPSGVKIMALKVTGATGRSSVTSIVNAIYYAIKNGADVINISMAVKGDISILKIAIQDAIKNNILVVTSAGNDGLPLAEKYILYQTDEVYVAPASYSSELLGLISVGATASKDALATFSNFGNKKVEIAAPGRDIFSTGPDNTYRSESGTSASSPMVAAAGAAIIHKLKNVNQAYQVADIETFLLQNSAEVESLKGTIANGKFLDFSILEAAWKNKGWIVEDFPEPTPLPPTTPEAPDGTPVDMPRAYIGSVETVIFNTQTDMLEISGWACRYGFPESQTLTLFFAGTNKISQVDEIKYVDFSTSQLPAEAAIQTACGTFNGKHRFKKEISSGQIRKMGMENTFIHAFLAYSNADASTLENGKGTFQVPKMPASDQTFDKDGEFEIKGAITSVIFNTGRKRLEISGWSCEVEDSLPVKVYIAANRPGEGYMTFDVVDANLPSSAAVRTNCETNKPHNFIGTISLSSIEQRKLEGQFLKMTSYGAFRNNDPGTVISSNTIRVPVLTPEQKGAEPVIGDVLGQIQSMNFIQATKSFEIKGWICEQGNSNPVFADILIGQVNRGNTANELSPIAVKTACQSTGNHNYTVTFPVSYGTSGETIAAGTLLRLSTTILNTRQIVQLAQPVPVPNYTIADPTPKQNIQAEITSITVDESTNSIQVRGWACDVGKNVTVTLQLWWYDAIERGRVVKSGIKTLLPSSQAVRTRCDTIGNRNFEVTYALSDTLAETYLIPGNKLSLYIYPTVEGEPFTKVDDPTYVLPNF